MNQQDNSGFAMLDKWPEVKALIRSALSDARESRRLRQWGKYDLAEMRFAEMEQKLLDALEAMQ